MRTFQSRESSGTVSFCARAAFGSVSAQTASATMSAWPQIAFKCVTYVLLVARTDGDCVQAFPILSLHAVSENAQYISPLVRNLLPAGPSGRQIIRIYLDERAIKEASILCRNANVEGDSRRDR